MAKRAGATSDMTMVSYLEKRIKSKMQKRRRKINPVICFGYNLIYPLFYTWISTWTEPEALYE